MTMKFNKACVIGGCGFIGSKLVNDLLGKGFNVNVLDDLSVGRRDAISEDAHLVVGDILDEDAASEAMQGCDIVFHLAARVAIRSSFEFAVEDTRTNFVGTASVLKVAHRLGTIRKIVFTSSMAIYADSEDPVPIAEDYNKSPLSPYGISKLAAEQLTHSMAKEAGMQSVVLRLFNTYGTGQALSPYVGVVTIFANRLREGKAPTIFGDGEQRRDFVHVDDVVQGLECAMTSDVTGRAFNIGSGQGTSVNQVFKTLARILEVDVEAVYEPCQAGEVRNSIADISSAIQELNYRPQHQFATSIEQVVNKIE